MAVEFFNFGNDETFHFFKWICESRKFSPDALIVDAFKQAESLDVIEALKVDRGDICYVLKDRLGVMLENILFHKVAYELDTEEMGLKIGDIWLEGGEPTLDSLLQPISALALKRIDCDVVAEALLIRAGKWAPGKGLPKPP